MFRGRIGIPPAFVNQSARAGLLARMVTELTGHPAAAILVVTIGRQVYTQ